MGIFSFFSNKMTIILGTVLVISLIGNYYLNSKNNSLREEVVKLEVSINSLNALIEKQNQAIKDLEANTTGLKSEYNSISEKYEKIKSEQANAEDYAKQNNISVSESKLILEKNKIQRGLDEFFNKNR